MNANVFGMLEENLAIETHNTPFLKKALCPSEGVENEVSNTPIEDISALIRDYSVDPERIIPTLRNVIKNFRDNYQENPVGDLELLENNTINYVKTLNILYGIGDKDAGREYKACYDLFQGITSEEVAARNPVLYVFHLKNFSLLHPEIRETIAQKYQVGEYPFERNLQKSKLYSRPLSLLLTPKLLRNF